MAGKQSFGLVPSPDHYCPILRSWRRWSRDKLAALEQRQPGRGTAGGPAAECCPPASTRAHTTASLPTSCLCSMDALLYRFRRKVQSRSVSPSWALPCRSAMPLPTHSSRSISSTPATPGVPAGQDPHIPSSWHLFYISVISPIIVSR